MIDASQEVLSVVPRQNRRQAAVAASRANMVRLKNQAATLGSLIKARASALSSSASVSDFDDMH